MRKARASLAIGSDVEVNRRPDIVEPATAAQWRSWLEENADAGHGVWLILHKGDPDALSYEAAVEEALAFGWIDSKPNRVDEVRYKLWVAPRRAGSGWSRINRERVARLIENGRMADRGMRVVEAAKEAGTWDALDGVLALEAPPDLDAALDSNPGARPFFDQFPPSSKRIILEWISQARTPETRRRRIEETVDLAARNIRAHHWRQPKG
jgi:uncharacterized protein YdeI (YjbR/CyaY-like superfamily)